MRLVGFVAVAALVVVACGSPTEGLIEPTEDSVGSADQAEAVDVPLTDVILIWVNQVGLGQYDLDLWTARLDLACAEGVWDDEVADRLAAGFVAEDEPVSVRSPDAGPVDLSAAAQALWLMAVNYCRTSFPEGEIEDGPPYFGG